MIAYIECNILSVYGSSSNLYDIGKSTFWENSNETMSLHMKLWDSSALNMLLNSYDLLNFFKTDVMDIILI